MPKKPQTLATVSVAFHEDGDATFKFDVNRDVAQPTSETVQIILFAKVFADLVSSLAGSEAMPQIRALLADAATAEHYDEDD